MYINSHFLLENGVLFQYGGDNDFDSANPGYLSIVDFNGNEKKQWKIFCVGFHDIKHWTAHGAQTATNGDFIMLISVIARNSDGEWSSVYQFQRYRCNGDFVSFFNFESDGILGFCMDYKSNMYVYEYLYSSASHREQNKLVRDDHMPNHCGYKIKKCAENGQLLKTINYKTQNYIESIRCSKWDEHLLIEERSKSQFTIKEANVKKPPICHTSRKDNFQEQIWSAILY